MIARAPIGSIHLPSIILQRYNTQGASETPIHIGGAVFNPHTYVGLAEPGFNSDLQKLGKVDVRKLS